MSGKALSAAPSLLKTGNASVLIKLGTHGKALPGSSHAYLGHSPE